MYSPLSVICRLITGQAAASEWAAFDPALWRSVADQAEIHGVAPLLYWKLKEGGQVGQIPAAVSAQLQHSYYRSAAQNALLFRELDRILQALAVRNTRVIVLKGGHLARSLYLNQSLRPINDLDLLAHPADLPHILQELIRLGYHNPGSKLYPPGSHLDRVISHDVHLIGGPDKRARVELHWRLLSPERDVRSPSLDLFWNSTLPLENQPGSPQFLAPEANLLYLSAHLALQHGLFQARLIWLYDLYLIATCCQPNWHEVVDLARQLKWADPLRAGLTSARDLFDLVLPPGLLDELQADSDPATAALVRRKSRSTGSHALDTWTQWGEYGWNPQTRLRMAVAEIFPTREYMRQRYRIRSSWVWPFYYPFRWWSIGVDLTLGFTRFVYKRIALLIQQKR